MGEISKSNKFILFKINVLKSGILLTSIFAAFFFFFHLTKTGINYLSLGDLFLSVFSFYIYKIISVKNYKLYASIEYIAILFSILILSVFYKYNVYMPVWMFGTLIVFTLCTDLVIGTIFLILTMIMFDFVFFNRVTFDSFVTLNIQFIAYFLFGVALIKKIEQLQEESYIYENFLFNYFNTSNFFNKRDFEKIMNKFLKRAKQENKEVLFLILDINNLSDIYNQYGNEVKDLVIDNIVKRIKKNIRQNDLLGKLNDETFGILIKDYKNSANIIKKIEESISNLSIKVNEKQINVNIFIGGIISKMYNYKSLYEKANEALNEAKKTKNKIEIFLF